MSFNTPDKPKNNPKLIPETPRKKALADLFPTEIER